MEVGKQLGDSSVGGGFHSPPPPRGCGSGLATHLLWPPYPLPGLLKMRGTPILIVFVLALLLYLFTLMRVLLPVPGVSEEALPVSFTAVSPAPRTTPSTGGHLGSGMWAQSRL